MQKVTLKPKEEQLPVQIFPDPQESAEESSTRMKRRLPSIVVELTESGEVESGELRWPPDDMDPEAPLEFELDTDSPLRTHPDPSRPPHWGQEKPLTPPLPRPFPVTSRKWMDATDLTKIDTASPLPVGQ